jgi:hypothetical protein
MLHIQWQWLHGTVQQHTSVYYKPGLNNAQFLPWHTPPKQPMVWPVIEDSYTQKHEHLQDWVQV